MPLRRSLLTHNLAGQALSKAGSDAQPRPLWSLSPHPSHQGGPVRPFGDATNAGLWPVLMGMPTICESSAISAVEKSF
eukprot:3586514-Prymnesium_polylepis.1